MFQANIQLKKLLVSHLILEKNTILGKKILSQKDFSILLIMNGIVNGVVKILIY